MTDIKATTNEDRTAILQELREALLGTAQEWLRAWRPDADEGVLHLVDEMRLRYYEDGTTIVELDGETVLRVRLSVEAEVLEYLEAVNEPVGGVLDRTWATVPSGWFVQTPKGAWLEVGETSLQAGGVQHVSLVINGQAVVYPRNPAHPVKARRGSTSSTARDDALASLETAFTTAVLRDGEGPMQS